MVWLFIFYWMLGREASGELEAHLPTWAEDCFEESKRPIRVAVQKQELYHHLGADILQSKLSVQRGDCTNFLRAAGVPRVFVL